MLLDLLERDEFLYAWLHSDQFFNNLELIFELHLPSKTDFDTIYNPYFHEYLPGYSEFVSKFLKNYHKAQTCMKFT